MTSIPRTELLYAWAYESLFYGAYQPVVRGRRIGARVEALAATQWLDPDRIAAAQAAALRALLMGAQARVPYDRELFAREHFHPGLHVSDENPIVEVLRDGRPAAPGESGTVAITDLRNTRNAVRAVRERRRRAEGPRERCPCGRGLLRRLTRVSGLAEGPGLHRAQSRCLPFTVVHVDAIPADASGKRRPVVVEHATE
jgi:phenylacetate-coenzyme A ligase PaaK-like adenylate-forming protein